MSKFLLMVAMVFPHAYAWQDTFESIGKNLRAEIDKTYKELQEQKKLKPGEPADISAVVLKYIPVHSTFDEAEIILKAAGFQVGPRPGATVAGNRPDRYNVVSGINPYNSSLFVGKTSIWVSLIPPKPGNYKEIEKVEANISVSSI